MNYNEEGMPLLRHCKNCKWQRTTTRSGTLCHVRHKYIERRRLRALLCRFYKCHCAEESSGKQEE